MRQTARCAISAFLSALAVTVGVAPVHGATPTFVSAAAQRRQGRAAVIARPVSVAPGGNTVQRRRPPVSRALPEPANFREEDGRGLLVKVWINDFGPYTFALDTGAGATIISERVATDSRVTFINSRDVRLSGLSGMSETGREASLRSLALGAQDNYLPGAGFVIVTGNLPPDLDGVLDPTESYYPLGYTIDFPQGMIASFDPRATPLRGLAQPEDGAIVSWLFDGNSRRPFVSLDAGRRALLDTGSGFGLAISESAARSFGVAVHRGGEHTSVQDLGRGRVSAQRIEPLTVRLGALVLRRIPTDLLAGTTDNAPVLLGRDALRPFEISFDPLSRMIRLRPGAESPRR